MLIRNITSGYELENKKKQQAEILQLEIDNEAIKEKRVADFKNPNKPPPVPPQYRTAAEIQGDIMEQQKITIENLKSLGLDNIMASQVSIDMARLPEGTGAYLKFNKFFPAFKTRIEKNVNLKSIDVATLMAEIKTYFEEIDDAVGLNVSGTKSTDFFNNFPLFAKTLMSRNDIENIVALLDDIKTDYPADIDDVKVDAVINVYNRIKVLLPTEDQLEKIDLLPKVERTKLNKQIDKLFSKFNFPKSSEIASIFGKYNKLRNPTTAKETVVELENAFNKIKKRGVGTELKIITDAIAAYEATLAAGATAITAPTPALLGLPLYTSIADPDIKNNLDYINANIANLPISNLMRHIEIVSQNEGVIFPPSMGYAKLFGFAYINDPPTFDGLAPNGSTGIDNNLIISDGAYNRTSFIPNGVYHLSTGTNISKLISKTGEYKARTYDASRATWAVASPIQLLNINQFLKRTVQKSDGSLTEINAYGKIELVDIIRAQEQPNLERRVMSDPTYRPATDVSSRITNFPDKTGADTFGARSGFGLKEKKKKKSKYESDSSSEEEKKMRDIHIDINSHNGKDYKMSGDGFIKRRIKIGKGLEVRNDEPKFRQFGKYIIHMPQLRNNNILNLKHKSGGSIPSIKPVHVDDNYKDFIIDILDSGRVNDRHYTSLTEPEQNHFLKAVRGAGIIDDLKLKTKNNDIEKEEIKRLELLLGEVNAGNDNAGILKEARTLIKKYVSNGRISRQKGLDMLLELE